MDPSGPQAACQAPVRTNLAIVGAGALASVYGVRMASHGTAISFIVRPHRVDDPSPIVIECISTRERHSLDHPVRVARVPQECSCVALAVRAENLDDSLEALVRSAPDVPVISLTPLLPTALRRLRAVVGDRLVVAMPGVVSYADSTGTFRYWLPRVAPTMFDDRSGSDRSVRAVVDCMTAAGIPVKFESHVDAMNTATTVTFLPLVLLLDAAGGTAARALQERALLKLAFQAVTECRNAARFVGEVPAWAHFLTRFIGARTIRVGVALGHRAAPESVRFVEQHFGTKTHAQNVLLGREVIAIGGQFGVEMDAMRRLTDACADRAQGGPGDA
jgi:ketopantoate reductase